MPAQLAAPLDPLTPREMDVLALLAEGVSKQAIANMLVVTVETGNWYDKQFTAS